MKNKIFHLRYLTNSLFLVFPKLLSTIVSIWVVASYNPSKSILYLSLIAAASNDFGILRKMQILFLNSDLTSDAPLVKINEWIRKEVQSIYPGLIFLGLVFTFYFGVSPFLTVAYLLIIHSIIIINCLAYISDIQSKFKLSTLLRVLNTFLLIWVVVIDTFNEGIIILSILISLFSFKGWKFEEFKFSNVILSWPTFVYILERNVLVALFPSTSLVLKNILLSMEIAARIRVGLVQIAQEALRQIVISGGSLKAINSKFIIIVNSLLLLALLFQDNISINELYFAVIVFVISGCLVVWNEISCELLALGEIVTKISVISSIVILLFLHLLNLLCKLTVDIGLVVMIGYVSRYTLQAIYLKKFVVDKVKFPSN